MNSYGDRELVRRSIFNTAGPFGNRFTRDTVVAEIVTELICFEPEVCICNGNLI